MISHYDAFFFWLGQLESGDLTRPDLMRPENQYRKIENPQTPTIRPTQAIPLGNDLYKILPTPDYDPEDETWEFLPGSIVRCDTPVDPRDGKRFLRAYAIQNDDGSFTLSQEIPKHGPIKVESRQRGTPTRKTKPDTKGNFGDDKNGKETPAARKIILVNHKRFRNYLFSVRLSHMRHLISFLRSPLCFQRKRVNRAQRPTQD